MAELNNGQTQEPVNQTQNQNVNEPAGTEPTTTEPTTDPSKTEPVTLESLMVQIKAAQAEVARLKTANDKLSSESGTLRKQLREKMTAEEQEAEAKAQREAAKEEENKKIRRENEILKGTARYLDMGFSKELAEETATAAADGDQATIDANYKKWQAAEAKRIEASLREELRMKMPEPSSGNQGGVDYEKMKMDAIAAGDKVAYASAVTAEWREKTKA